MLRIGSTGNRSVWGASPYGAFVRAERGKVATSTDTSTSRAVASISAIDRAVVVPPASRRATVAGETPAAVAKPFGVSLRPRIIMPSRSWLIRHIGPCLRPRFMGVGSMFLLSVLVPSGHNAIRPANGGNVKQLSVGVKRDPHLLIDDAVRYEAVIALEQTCLVIGAGPELAVGVTGAVPVGAEQVL